MKDSARILISMPESFLQQIDNLAQEEHRSRSELIREALRRYMRSNSTNMSNPIKAKSNAERVEELLGE